MSADATLWLNQAHEELRMAALIASHARSPRRAEDLAHAQASLQRMGEHLALAEAFIALARQGVCYSVQPPPLNLFLRC